MTTDTAEPPTHRSPAHGYRALHALNLALLTGLWLFTAMAYGGLPDQVPAHMGVSGVTRWTSRQSGIWFLLPILGTFHAFLLYALSGLGSSGAAEGINLPQKKRLLTLPREGRRYALEPVRPFMFAMTAWLLALMLIIQYQLYAAARAGPAGDYPGWLLWPALGLSLFPLVGVWWLNRRIRGRIDAWQAG